MALLNENRNRIPLVDVLPASGDDGGIRGQQRMSAAGNTIDTVTCAVSDTGGTPSTVSIATMTFISKLFGIAGDAITIELADNADGGLPTVGVTGTAILVSADITTTGTATEQQVVDAINADANASALVSASTTAGATLVAVTVATALAGGVGSQASATVQGVTYTAVVGGSSGNDINIVYVADATATAPKVSVSGTTITVTDAVGATNDIAAAVNSSSLASRLVVASGTATAFAAMAGTPLVNGASNSVWV